MHAAPTHQIKSLGLSDLGLSYLVAMRVLLLTVALLSATICTFFSGPELSERASSVYFPVAILYGLTALSAFWLKSGMAGSWFRYLQLTFDAALVTGVIYVTGGTYSPFLFLYLPLVMVCAALFSQVTALVVAGLCGAVYTCLVASLHLGWIVAADGSSALPTPLFNVALQIIGLVSAMILVGAGTSFLVSRLRKSDVLLAQQNRDLVDLRQREKLLVDNMTDGIVTTQLDYSITSVSAIACTLLKIEEAQAIGKKLPDILDNICAVDGGSGRLDLNTGELQEAIIMHPGLDMPINVIVKREHVVDVQGRHVGSMFIFQDVTRLRSVEGQLEMQEHMARLLAEKQPDQSTSSIPGFVGESPVMHKVFRLIERVAPSDATVLVNGESGTGKELVAKAIHRGSQRSDGDFVAVNCGAIPENLIESQLFGHKKGSFTGADSDYGGLFRQADRGTIFLDEIGELPVQMQTKLLRVIQEKHVRPVGGDKDIAIDVRIVAATNKNLKREIEAGRFREDLYYRLNVISMSLPPLRDRKDDIPILTKHILKRLVAADRSPIVPAATMQLLMSYNYPGNVRELENILERAQVLSGEVILPEHLPESVRNFRQPAPGQLTETTIIIDESITLPVDLDQILGRVERQYLEIALLRTSGAKKKAADLLGINFRSFRYRLQKFGISDE